jgi:hypothetical protein
MLDVQYRNTGFLRNIRTNLPADMTWRSRGLESSGLSVFANTQTNQRGILKGVLNQERRNRTYKGDIQASTAK